MPRSENSPSTDLCVFGSGIGIGNSNIRAFAQNNIQANALACSVLDFKALGDQDAVMIITDHTDIDYAAIVDNAQLVIDTRNATKDVTSGREKIVKA